MLDHDLNLDTRVRCPVCDGDQVVACAICDGMGRYLLTIHLEPEHLGGKYFVDCNACNGQGYVTCPRCHGSGEDTRE